MTEKEIRQYIPDGGSSSLRALDRNKALWEIAAQLAAQNEARAKADERNAALDEEDSRKRDENQRKLITITQELGTRLDRLGAPMPIPIMPKSEQ